MYKAFVAFHLWSLEIELSLQQKRNAAHTVIDRTTKRVYPYIQAPTLVTALSF